MKHPAKSLASNHQAINRHLLALAEQPFVSDISRLVGPVETRPKDTCKKWHSVFDTPVIEPEQSS